MTFYLLTLSYFNNVNVGRNILINPQLKRILFLAATGKNKTKLRKTERKRKNKITPMKVTLAKMRYQI